MAGLRAFNSNGSVASVVNEGSLNAALGGYIALLAPTVRNNGVIIAELGTVALVGGTQYVLTFSDSSLNALSVSPATIATLVTNGNAVYAPGGLIILSAQGAHQIQSGIVGNSGVLDATGIDTHAGVIELSATQSITVSGVIKADAPLNSNLNGGMISIISDLSNSTSQTNINGVISAKGGSLGAVGGRVETSGSSVMVSELASVNTTTVNGVTGL